MLTNIFFGQRKNDKTQENPAPSILGIIHHMSARISNETEAS